MWNAARAAVLAASGFVLAGCLPAEPSPTDAPRTVSATARKSAGSGTVIGRSQLGRAGGDLLTALQGRVPNLRVERIPGRRCPLVIMRGERTLNGSPDPVIYVDGTSMNDTCILTQLRAADVSSVELYPGGVSMRAGYGASPNGLILVFLLDGDEA
jgi:TonB-dependent receptor-like protein